MRNNTANDKEKYFRVPVYYQVCEYVTVRTCLHKKNMV